MKQLTHGSLFAGIGGFDLGFERAGMEAKWQVEIEPFCQKVLKARFPAVQRALDIRTCRGLTSSVPASHARIGRSRDREKACLDNVAASFTSLRESCTRFDPLGSSSRMFPDFSVVTKDETLRKSSGFSWSSAGMGFNGVCLTANFSESLNDADVCSLSDVLESHVPQRFFLSPRAAKGILRRAKKRGRDLPPRLQAALESLAMRQDEGEKMTTTSRSQSQLAQNIMATVAHAETGQTILYSIMPMNSSTDYKAFEAKVTQPIMAAGQSHGNQGGDVILTSYWDDSQQTDTLDCSMLAKGQRRFPCVLSDVSNPDTPADSSQHSQLSAATLSVRRLTPTECEILQGFPKGWTLPDTEL